MRFVRIARTAHDVQLPVAHRVDSACAHRKAAQHFLRVVREAVVGRVLRELAWLGLGLASASSEVRRCNCGVVV